MIGLGPYIVQSQTPLGKLWLEEHGEESAAKQEANRVALLERTTRMYALARIMLGNVNIAATTALEALDPEGRELALRRGANVVMPIITPQRLRGRQGPKLVSGDVQDLTTSALWLHPAATYLETSLVLTTFPSHRVLFSPPP